MTGHRQADAPRIVVVFGGIGAEKEVSLVSGEAVLNGIVGQGLRAEGVRIDTA